MTTAATTGALVLAFMCASAGMARAQIAAGTDTASTHLDEAARMLDGIPLNKLKEADDAEEEFEELRKNFAEMMASYRSSGPAPPSAESKAINWREKFSAVERKLTAMIGGGAAFDGPVEAAVATPVAAPSTPANRATPQAPDTTSGSTAPAGTAGSSGTVGTAGAAGGAAGATGTVGTLAVEVSTIGIEDLDPGVRRQLQNFRRELELFFISAIGVHQ